MPTKQHIYGLGLQQLNNWQHMSLLIITSAGSSDKKKTMDNTCLKCFIFNIKRLLGYVTLKTDTWGLLAITVLFFPLNELHLLKLFG